jgi:hypothetical protein
LRRYIQRAQVHGVLEFETNEKGRSASEGIPYNGKIQEQKANSTDSLEGDFASGGGCGHNAGNV